MRALTNEDILAWEAQARSVSEGSLERTELENKLSQLTNASFDINNLMHNFDTPSEEAEEQEVRSTESTGRDSDQWGVVEQMSTTEFHQSLLVRQTFLRNESEDNLVCIMCIKSHYGCRKSAAIMLPPILLWIDCFILGKSIQRCVQITVKN